MESLTTVMSKNKRKAFVIYIKIIALAIATFIIVLSTINIPRTVALKPGQTPVELENEIKVKPYLGFPIPFYIEGDVSAIRMLPAKAENFPVHLYPSNPMESPGSAIVWHNFLMDFIIFFFPLLLLLLLKLKYKSLHKERSTVNFIKQMGVLFVLSVAIMIGSVFFHPMAYYRKDLPNGLGFPLPFLVRYAPLNNSNTTTSHFLYHPSAKYILLSLFHRSSYNIPYLSASLLITFAVVLLLYYAYSDL